MMDSIGFPVEHGEIVAIMKDHSKTKFEVKLDYPDYPVKVIRFDFDEGDRVSTRNWLYERFLLIIKF